LRRISGNVANIIGDDYPLPVFFPQLIVARSGFVAKPVKIKENLHKKRFSILEVLESLLSRNVVKTIK
jgi:hypothetical protein